MRSRSANPECDYYHVPYTSNSTCGLPRTSVGQLDASMRDPSAQLNYVEEVSTSGNQRSSTASSSRCRVLCDAACTGTVLTRSMALARPRRVRAGDVGCYGWHTLADSE